MYAVNEIRKGNMDVMVEINTTEEFGALSEAFNQMIRELKYSQEKLGLTNKNLEKIYKELEKAMPICKKPRKWPFMVFQNLQKAEILIQEAHIKRMQYYAKLIAIEIKNQEKFKDKIDENFINDIYTSSALHDVGKVGVPDAVLLKPGKLEPYERSIIETHTVIGGNALKETEEMLQKESNGETSFLSMGKEIAYYQHERWDGNGYPAKLKGEEIPLAARIVAVAGRI
jgi:response regulator RpfG family c-di-GMP phosphodiesterase